MADLLALQRIAESDFADIVLGTRIVDAKLRVLFTDSSYLDFWWSLEIPGRFAHPGNAAMWTARSIATTTCRTAGGYPHRPSRSTITMAAQTT